MTRPEDYEHQIKIGDVVRLRSGSCSMTVVELSTEGKPIPKCAWLNPNPGDGPFMFSNGGYVVEASFPGEALVPVRGDKVG